MDTILALPKIEEDLDDETYKFIELIEKNQSGATFDEVEEKLFDKLKNYIEYSLISTADAICCTCFHAYSRRIQKHKFKHLLIDEATQSKEPEILLPMLLGAKQVILVGDHKQLGPVILSDRAKALGLDVSLFERAISELRCQNHLLDTQYRMHPAISKYPNTQFYNEELKDGVTAQERNELLKCLH